MKKAKLIEKYQYSAVGMVNGKCKSAEIETTTATAYDAAVHFSNEFLDGKSVTYANNNGIKNDGWYFNVEGCGARIFVKRK